MFTKLRNSSSGKDQTKITITVEALIEILKRKGVLEEDDISQIAELEQSILDEQVGS